MAEHKTHSTNHATCIHTSISGLATAHERDKYREFVNPADYDFGLERGGEHHVLGIIERKGTTWLYLTPEQGPIEVGIFPSVLFSCDDCTLPNMCLSINRADYSDLAILPAELSVIPNWFERYVDGDEQIVKLVNTIISRNRA